MTDTKYAQLVAQGYDPDLKQKLIFLGEHPDIARKMARFFGALRGKTLDVATQEAPKDRSAAVRCRPQF